MHVGINLNKYDCTKPDIESVVNKIRSTFFGLMELGLHHEFAHPASSIKVYNSVVLPRALFGSEMWSSLSVANFKRLETIHHYCLKKIQGLPMRTRSDKVLSLVGCYSLSTIIEKKKLSFLALMCRLPCHYAAKKLFFIRLFQHQHSSNSASKSAYITDIRNILVKYGLNHVFDNFLNECIFPSKLLWKRITNKAIHQYVDSSWCQRISQSIDFSRFSIIHKDYKMCLFWELCRNKPVLKNACSKAVELLCLAPVENRRCEHCHAVNVDIVSHVLFHCSNVEVNEIRYQYSVDIINVLGVHVFTYIDSLSEILQENIILGGMIGHLTEHFPDFDVLTFETTNCKFLYKLFRNIDLYATTE